MNSSPNFVLKFDAGSSGCLGVFLLFCFYYMPDDLPRACIFLTSTIFCSALLFIFLAVSEKLFLY